MPRVVVADGIFTATEDKSVALTDEIESGDGRSGEDLVGLFGPDAETTELEIGGKMVRLGHTLLDSCLHEEIRQESSKRQ